MSEGTLQDRYNGVTERVARAAERSGRRPEDVILVAVTKYAAADDIRALIDLGHRDFGENRVLNLLPASLFRIRLHPESELLGADQWF